MGEHGVQDGNQDTTLRQVGGAVNDVLKELANFRIRASFGDTAEAEVLQQKCAFLPERKVAIEQHGPDAGETLGLHGAFIVALISGLRLIRGAASEGSEALLTPRGSWW